MQYSSIKSHSCFLPVATQQIVLSMESVFPGGTRLVPLKLYMDTILFTTETEHVVEMVEADYPTLIIGLEFES